ncbi:Zinc finger protein [Quillaja saponaria]|uniref:RING-type E3 ubiquitin transferase n=1 Tax=Quillaja saponaria TaxID=32244 RepID=A0AAD7Q1G7_QUISA|nr:Zinc finger protein [Quillaja saponaria]
MDDCCAVCAEPLEWVAYGPCGHREVCSTCVVRLRFIFEDRRCCICKTECNPVFITKALGDYTRMINDFTLLPFEVREGQVGSYWYHEDTHCFFDDVEHYKMIKAMCRLSCSECDKTEDQSHDSSKRRMRFKRIEQLKGHLFHRHRLLMCSLCLGGRKVFICEQKLYTRSQLNQHISTGDSEVDGTESERGGFMGHPVCEFCRVPFYGDNELYSHMSTEHYTCHICQRQHPGHYEYFKNYDDLEIHFRQEHFLCEDEACLAKKFVVFQAEAEMKRHNTIEHGGRMSRSKRNAALKIPTSFQYQRSNEQDHRRGRASTSGQVTLDHEDDIDPIIQPFESLATTDPESSVRYLQALGQNSRNAPLQESSFPPLRIASSSDQQNSRPDSEGSPSNTMAAHLRRQSKVSVLNSAQAWPVASRGSAIQSSNSLHSRIVPGISRVTAKLKPAASSRPAPSTSASSAQAAPAATQAKKPTVPNVVDVHTANKSLVEKIHAALEYDPDKYTTFKDISAQYCQGLIGTVTYMEFVQQFGLSHLVLELAKLCPDGQKQKELVDCYNASLQRNALQEAGWGRGSTQLKDRNVSNTGKGKSIDTEESNAKDKLANGILSTVRQLQSSYRPSDEQAEVLSKGRYRSVKGKSKVLAAEQQINVNSGRQPLIKLSGHSDSSFGGVSNQNTADGGRGGSKQHKKSSKFLRVRLGDGSSSALMGHRDADSGPADGRVDDNIDNVRLPVRRCLAKRGTETLFLVGYSRLLKSGSNIAFGEAAEHR